MAELTGDRLASIEAMYGTFEERVQAAMIRRDYTREQAEAVARLQVSQAEDFGLSQEAFTNVRRAMGRPVDPIEHEAEYKRLLAERDQTP